MVTRSKQIYVCEVSGTEIMWHRHASVCEFLQDVDDVLCTCKIRFS